MFIASAVDIGPKTSLLEPQQSTKGSDFHLGSKKSYKDLTKYV